VQDEQQLFIVRRLIYFLDENQQVQLQTLQQVFAAIIKDINTRPKPLVSYEQVKLNLKLI